MKNSAHAEPDVYPDPSPPAASPVDPVLRAIALSPSGLSVGEIERQASCPHTRRTLQRRLSRLVVEGVLSKSGQGRGTRYVLRDGAAGVTTGYEHTLVAQYRPNLNFYLPLAARQGFRALNRVLRTRHAPTLRANAGTTLTALLSPHWLREFAWNSSRLAGGCYERNEADSFLETGAPPPGRPSRDAQILLNHHEAAVFIQEAERPLDEMTLRNLHAILTDNLLADPADGGLLRRSSYSHAPRNPAQLLRLLVERVNAIEDACEQSCFLFLHLSCLQLFAHGNARLARTAANLPLLRAGLCPILFHEVPLALYRHALHDTVARPRLHLLRDLYVRAYEESCDYCVRLPAPGAMNPLRLQFRKELGTMVRGVVRAALNRDAAARHLASPALESAPPVPATLQELAMLELDALHPGNIYRYGLTLDTFLAWKRNWMQTP